MLSEAELNALVAILNRTPLSQAEALWVEQLVKRWLQALRQPEKTG